MINGGTATVFVSNMDNAVKFYTDTLGMKIQYRAGDEWCSIDAGGGLVIGLHPSGPKSPKPGSRGAISVGLGVTEPIERVMAELKKRGVVFESDVVDDDPVKLAFFGDPDGNELYLCEYKTYPTEVPRLIVTTSADIATSAKLGKRLFDPVDSGIIEQTPTGLSSRLKKKIKSWLGDSN